MTRGSPRTGLHPVGAPPRHDARALAWLSAVLVVAALGLGVALAATGESWPSPAAVVVFALLAWFAVNRYTFFPSELAVTSESAVLIAAVVAFHRDAPFLGPWCVAALVGPLDAVHWEHRAFSRMGFNAAHQMLAVVTAAGAYSAVAAGANGGAVEWLTAGAAVVAYAIVVASIGIVAQRVWSRLHLLDAVREVLPLDGIIVPLGALGACAGIAATHRGWWALPLVLVPVAFVPELVLGHARSLAAACSRSRHVRTAVVVLAGALLLAPVAAVVGGWAPAALAVLVLACLAALELSAPRRPLVPPLAGVVVASAVALVGRGEPWWSPARTLGALAAGILVAGVAALTAPSGSRAAEVARAGWALPLFAVGVAGSIAVVRVGPAGAAVPVVLVVASAALVAAWAPPPWSSAVLRTALGTRHFTARRWVLVALVVLALVAASGAARTEHTSGLTRACCALGALVATEVALTVAAVGARLWRFDPLRRRVVATSVVVTAIVALAGIPLLARDVSGWIVPAVAAAGAVALLVGDRPARLGDHSDRAPDHESDRA